MTAAQTTAPAVVSTGSLPDGRTWQTVDLGTVTLGKTIYRVEEQSYSDGSEGTTWLIGPRGAAYFLRGFLGEDTGARQVISFKSGAPLRQQGNEVRVYHLGNAIEVVTRPRPIH